MTDRFDPRRHREAGHESWSAHDRDALRASDEDRERTVSRLRHAAGEGRLSPDELEQRLQAAYAARTHAELEWLVSDLPGDPEPTERTRRHEPGPRRAKLALALAAAVAVTVLLIAAAAVLGFGRSSSSGSAGGPYPQSPAQQQPTP